MVTYATALRLGTAEAEQVLHRFTPSTPPHREVVPLVATDVAVLNHPTIGGRIRAQDSRLRTMLVAPDTSAAATLRAEAASGRSAVP